MQLPQKPVSPDEIGFAPAGRNSKPPPTPSKFLSPTEGTLDSTTTSSEDKDSGSPLPYRRFPFWDDEAAAQLIANLSQHKKSAGTSGGAREKRQAKADGGVAPNMFKASARGGFGVRMCTNVQGQSTPLNTWRQSVEHSVSYSDRVFGLRRRVPPAVPQSADATPSHDNSMAAEVKESGSKSPNDGEDQPRDPHGPENNGSASSDRHAKVDGGGAIAGQNAEDYGFTVVDRSEEFASTVSKFSRHTPSVFLQTADSVVNRASGASSADYSADNAAAGNDQEDLVIGHPLSNETTEDSAQSEYATLDPSATDVADQHESAGIISVLVGFVTFMLMWIPIRVGSISQHIARFFKSIWPTASHVEPSVNDNTEQATGEGNAASGETRSLPSSLVANSSGTPTSYETSVDLKLESTPDDAKPYEEIDGTMKESHALYMSGIVFAVASRATVGISIDQLQLMLRAQYGRDVSPLTEAGVDVPLKEYIRRFIRSVRVYEDEDGQDVCILEKNL